MNNRSAGPRRLELLQAGHLVVANDAARLSASLVGTHLPTGRTIGVRLAGRPSQRPKVFQP